MIFGTDGIRGLVDKDINTNLAYNVGKSFALLINKHKLPKMVLIGRDTRLSGDTYANALACGLSDYGVSCRILGIVSTPIVSFLVSKLPVAGGVMITASHNDYTYNGIKLFDDLGNKLSKELENEVEKNLSNNIQPKLNKGKIIFDDSLLSLYKDYVLSEFKCNMDNMTIVIDCANGGNYKIAPEVYRSMGANVIKLSCKDNGQLINNKCGANHIENLKMQVVEHDADFGIAFDGDGDRLRIVLPSGKDLTGDQIIFILAKYLKNKNKLNSMTIVGTIMSNLGLGYSLNQIGITMLRTDVGDKNVINLMKEKHLCLGGESSGHICLYEHNCTCDALIASLYLLKAVIEDKIDIESTLLELKHYPSLMKNVEVSLELRKNYNKNLELHKQIDNISKEYKEVKIIVRPSGTEPVIRLYVESVSDYQNELVMQKLLNLFKK